MTSQDILDYVKRNSGCINPVILSIMISSLQEGQKPNEGEKQEPEPGGNENPKQEEIPAQ